MVITLLSVISFIRGVVKKLHRQVSSLSVVPLLVVAASYSSGGREER